jgi:AraC-like DNA-binding protein
MVRAPLHSQPIPFITLPNWVKAAAQCGFNIEPVFREVGVQTDLANLENATISQPQLDQVFEECMRRARRGHFPFVLGETFAFEYLPDIETFLTTSPTLRDAARVFDWVSELINPMIELTIEEDGAGAALVLNRDAVELPVRPWFTETVFASVIKFGRELLRERAQFARMTVRHPAPPYARTYRQYFKVPVVFGAPRNALEFDRALLDLPLQGGFPSLHEQAEVRVTRRLKRLPKRPALVAAVEDACERDPALLGLGIDAVARVVGIGARTLQRRLQDVGDSFGELLARVRYRQAMRLLDDGELDLERISERLGFSDRRSFTRAFSRWAGISPSAYRRRATK